MGWGIVLIFLSAALSKFGTKPLPSSITLAVVFFVGHLILGNGFTHSIVVAVVVGVASFPYLWILEKLSDSIFLWILALIGGAVLVVFTASLVASSVFESSSGFNFSFNESIEERLIGLEDYICNANNLEERQVLKEFIPAFTSGAMRKLVDAKNLAEKRKLSTADKGRANQVIRAVHIIFPSLAASGIDDDDLEFFQEISRKDNSKFFGSFKTARLRAMKRCPSIYNQYPENSFTVLKVFLAEGRNLKQLSAQLELLLGPDAQEEVSDTGIQEILNYQ